MLSKEELEGFVAQLMASKATRKLPQADATSNADLSNPDGGEEDDFTRAERLEAEEDPEADQDGEEELERDGK
jgi:hypothetical protein